MPNQIDSEDPEPESLEPRLRELSPVAKLGRLARQHDGPVYLVGGVVRDAILGRAVDDVDVAVGGDFASFLELASACFRRRAHDLGDRWQSTHRLLWHDFQIDLSRLQGDLAEDLSRRDFTINAMAVPLPLAEPGDGEAEDRAIGLVDPYDGVGDLHAGLLRCSSPRVFDADPLRLLRAVRYVAQLPGFGIEAGTAEEVVERAATIEEAAPERVQREWEGLLRGERWHDAVELAYELELGESTLVPSEGFRATRAWGAAEPADVATGADGDDAAGIVGRLAAVLRDSTPTDVEGLRALLRRRRWPGRIARTAARAAVWSGRLLQATDDTMARWSLDDRRAARLAALLYRVAEDGGEERSSSPARRLLTYARRAGEDRWVSGELLMEWGLAEGPEVGRLLAEIEEGRVRRRWADPAEARSWARERVREAATDDGGKGARQG